MQRSCRPELHKAETNVASGHLREHVSNVEHLGG